MTDSPEQTTPPLGGPLAGRFPWLWGNTPWRPAPTIEEWNEIGAPPDGFEELLCALDGLASALAHDGHDPAVVASLDPRAATPIPDEVHLYAGAAMWATARVRGLLHQYLTQPGHLVSDRDAVLLQGILLGAEMASTAGSARLFRSGYAPTFAGRGQQDTTASG